MAFLTAVFPIVIAMPTRDAHLQFEKWARDDKAVKDLLDKKSNLYSHYQRMYIGQSLCSGDLRILMMGYDARWGMCRKQPERCMANIRRYTNSLTTTIVFGWGSSAYGDEKMMQLVDGFSQFAELNQTGLDPLVDFSPWLRWLPDFLLPEKGLYLGHWLKAREEAKAGTIMRCFSEDLVGAQNAEGFSDDQASYITGTLLEAGSDTTSSTLYAFKAHEEIDRVIGPNRMPTMDDERDLQYVRGIVEESLRWMATTILGVVPHAVTQDDWYEGYLCPKNVNNVWAINMDSARHPRRFDPDRYRDDMQSLADAAANPDASKRDRFTFGAGRRISPGIHVAERSLFLGVARMLWAFDISLEVDRDGKPIIPDQEKLA
ncbi:cytochrome P450 [Parachaetomium inaequale]|uniref:Cytochrome P450 n=1 Tax=Parachaetomium inaequale TaxID=2588326 RepID=A0AAN6SQ63_9PEZI|nr:cytochrome P450 [Parachaetomium inaequale]